MTADQVDELFEDCMDEEDDDGLIPYIRKYIINLFQIVKLLLTAETHNAGVHHSVGGKDHYWDQISVINLTF